ncbi:VOC family protein [Cryobacterium cryoconiti]|uniref:VOC family protein n=1 Tax=Cryobacterium cryoconiti TaxID=1259239 RepID=A0A4Y8JYF8_9MICO|nr:VOC family protein [Cryobacterium cryoconiti]TFD34221.1 VOC family protein [Cryobacterium cryoconiti]
MFTSSDAFSSFSVDDIDTAKRFYGDTLGLDVRDGMMGNLEVRLGNSAQVFIYAKPDHVPATFTVLNFVTDDVEKTVDELNVRGVTTKIYGDDDLADMPPNDAKGIMRGDENRAEIAWFTDPAGNVLAVVAASV